MEPLISHRGRYLGHYPPRLHDHIRDSTERECRAFEMLAAEVGVRHVVGRMYLLNGWFNEERGADCECQECLSRVLPVSSEATLPTASSSKGIGLAA